MMIEKMNHKNLGVTVYFFSGVLRIIWSAVPEKNKRSMFVNANVLI